MKLVSAMKKTHFKPKRRSNRILPAAWVEDSWFVPIKVTCGKPRLDSQEPVSRRPAKTPGSLSVTLKYSDLRGTSDPARSRSVEVLIRMVPQPESLSGQECPRSGVEALRVPCPGETYPIRFGWPHRH